MRIGLGLITALAIGMTGCSRTAHNPVWSIAFSPDGNHFAAGLGVVGNTTSGPPWGGTGEVKLWSVPVWQLKWRQAEGFTCKAASVAFTPDGSILGAVSDRYRRNGPGNPMAGNVVRFWNLKDKTELPEVVLDDRGAVAEQFVFSPTAPLIYVCRFGSQSVAFDWTTGTEVFTFPKNSGGALKLTVSPDGNSIVSCRYSGAPSIQLIDALSGERITTAEFDGAIPSCAEFAPNGKVIAVGCDNGMIYWLRPDLGERTQVIESKLRKVNVLAFAHDGNTIGAAFDESAIILDVKTGKELKRFEGHPKNITAMAFSPDGKMLAVGFGKETARTGPTSGGIRIWDVNSGALIVHLQ